MRFPVLFVIVLLAGCRPPIRSTPVAPPKVLPAKPQGVPLKPNEAQPAVALPAVAETTAEQPPADPLNPRSRAFLAEVNGRLRDVYFDYDHSGLRPDAEAALRFDYELLRGLLADFPDLQVVVEGHCDERGSAEYNLALGDRRANQVVQYLVQLGLPESRLRPVSYGRERPQCVEQSEVCWQRNRRAHLMALESRLP